MFVGRKNELRMLNDAYRSGKDELVVLYGRRRIGKSSLVKRFAEKKKTYYEFEALEGETTPGQINHFLQQLKKQIDDPILDSVRFANWEQVFTYLTEKVIKRKTKVKKILFLDELPWMAAGRIRLVSLLKYYWDNHWKSKHVMLILCGSIASFMVKKVLHSNALYGRTTIEILLNSFDTWLGFAFERFCLKHAGLLALVMDFADDILFASPYFKKNDERFQIDLLYQRADRVITVCEIKHQNIKIGTNIIPEMQRKCALLKVPRGYALEKALISL